MYHTSISTESDRPQATLRPTATPAKTPLGHRAVRIPLLFCFAFHDATSFTYGITGLSGLVAIPLGILGAIITQQIWANFENKGCASVIVAAIICGILTSIPVFLSFMFLESAGISATVNAAGSGIWAVVMSAKIVVQAVWRFTLPHTISFWRGFKRY